MQETPVRFLGQEDPLEKGKATHSSILELPLCFPCGSAGKESTRNAGDLGLEDPLEKGKATHSSTLASKIPWTEEPGRLQSKSHGRRSLGCSPCGR